MIRNINQSFLSISLCFLGLSLALLISFEIYLKGVSFEIMNSWVKSESIEMARGNFLTAVSKNQRILFSSQFISGVSLIDNRPGSSNMNILTSYGKLTKIKAKSLSKNPNTIEVSRLGLLHYISFFRSPYNRDFNIIFEINPPVVKNIFFITVLVLATLLITCFLFIKKYKDKENTKRLMIIKESMNSLINDDNLGSLILKEVPELKEIWEGIVSKFRQMQKSENENLIKIKLGELSAQLAHDIRSPLTALEMVVKDIKQLPEEDRIILRGSVQRIQDLANNLLTAERNKDVEGDQIKKISSVLIPSLVERMISEKRAQLKEGSSIKIKSDFQDSSYGLFSKVNPIELKRVISNLVNNSIDAIKNAGIINIYLTEEENEILISVEDNGKGIPKKLVNKIFEKGKSFEKKSGNGLGLSHAKESIESWKGLIKIDSQLGRGTKVNIQLPKIRPPKWFVPSIDLGQKTKIMVLDDDPNIHRVWEGRFSRYELKLGHCHTPEEMLQWVNANGDENVLYLCDYELIGHKKTGLDLIEDLGLREKAILITSHFENKKIRQRCERLNVRLIPKSMAPIVPIKITNSEKLNIKQSQDLYDVVHVDDDKYLRLAWKKKAVANNIKLLSLSSTLIFLVFQDNAESLA